MTIVPSMGDLQTAARTIFGEARGESDEGQRWVAATIITRAQRGGWWGGTLDGREEAVAVQLLERPRSEQADR